MSADDGVRDDMNGLETLTALPDVDVLPLPFPSGMPALCAWWVLITTL